MLIMLAVISTAWISFVGSTFSKFTSDTPVVETLVLTVFLFNTFISQSLVFSYLFFFGCCVSVGQSKMENATELIEDQEEKNYCMQVFKTQLQNHIMFKESVSLGLFLIFTLLTIVLIFFVFITIGMSSTENILSKTSYIAWCIELMLIIVYLALAADDVDQIRLELINIMW